MITFGKYKGMSLIEIACKDMDYLNWCKKNVCGFKKKLDAEDLRALYFIEHPSECIKRDIGELKFDGKLAEYIRDNHFGVFSYGEHTLTGMVFLFEYPFGKYCGESKEENLVESIDRAMYDMILEYENRLPKKLTPEKKEEIRLFRMRELIRLSQYSDKCYFIMWEKLLRGEIPLEEYEAVYGKVKPIRRKRKN